LDFVFPKKWRPPWLTDPGEVGASLEPAQEHVEVVSKLPAESATDQSKSHGRAVLTCGAGGKEWSRLENGWTWRAASTHGTQPSLLCRTVFLPRSFAIRF
jgi:hypothetical protein